MVVRTVGAISRSRSRSASLSSQDPRKREDSCSTSSDRYEGLSKTNIYICPIPTSYSKRDLEDIFKKFGKIINATILTKLSRRSTNRSIDGFPAFVDFYKHSAAKRAVEEYNGVRIRDIFGSRAEGDVDARLLVRFADAKGKRPASARRRRDLNERRVVSRGSGRRRANWDRPLRFPRRRLGRRRSRSRSRIRIGRRSRSSSSRDRGRGRRSISRSPRSWRRRSTSSRSRNRSNDRASSRSRRARYTSADSVGGPRRKSISRSWHSSEESPWRKRRRLNSKADQNSLNVTPNIPSNISDIKKTEVPPKVTPIAKSIDTKARTKDSLLSKSNSSSPKTGYPTRPPPQNMNDGSSPSFPKVTMSSKLLLSPPSSSLLNTNAGSPLNNRKKPEIKLPGAMEKFKVGSKPNSTNQKKPVTNAPALGARSQQKYIISGNISDTNNPVPKNQAPPKNTVTSRKQLEVKEPATLSREQSKVENPALSVNLPSRFPTVARVVELKEEENTPLTFEEYGLIKVSDQSPSRTKMGTVRTVLPHKTISASFPQELSKKVTSFSLPQVQPVEIMSSFPLPKVHQKKAPSTSFPQPKQQQKLTTPKINTTTIHAPPPVMPLLKDCKPINNSSAPGKRTHEKIYPIVPEEQTKKKTSVAHIEKPPVFSLPQQQNPYKIQHISINDVSLHDMNTVVKTSNRTVELNPWNHYGKPVATKVGVSKPFASFEQLRELNGRQLKAKLQYVKTAKPRPIRTPQPKPVHGPQPEPVQTPKPKFVKKPDLKPTSPVAPPAKKSMPFELSSELPYPSPEKKAHPLIQKVRQTPPTTSPLIFNNRGKYEHEVGSQGNAGMYTAPLAKSKTSTAETIRSREKVKSLLNKNIPTKEFGPINLTKVPSKPHPITEMNSDKRLGSSTTVHPKLTNAVARAVTPDHKKPKAKTLLPPVVKSPSTKRSPVEECMSPDQLKLRAMNEKEEEAFQKFKKQKIRVAWQTYLQDKAQIRLLETKNDELEEDIKQMEGKCRYWKDMFERTLTDYRQVKSELRKLKAQRLAF